MCKNAIGSDGGHLGKGISTSVLFMLGTVFAVLFGFLGLVGWSYRSGRARARRGEAFSPPGKLRWSAEERPE